jgi:hypothetical protein
MMMMMNRGPLKLRSGSGIPYLVSIVWASIVSISPSFYDPDSDSGSSFTSFSAGPPPPFQLCPWSRFVYFLPPDVIQELLARVMEERKDMEAFIAYFCALQRTGVEKLWPIQDHLSGFLVHNHVGTRRLMRELEPLLRQALA